MAKTPAWQRKEGKSEAGGLNAKGRASAKKQGMNLKPPQPQGGKRKKSFCARSKGQQDMHNIDCRKNPDKRICKARKRWKCESTEAAKAVVLSLIEDAEGEDIWYHGTNSQFDSFVKEKRGHLNDCAGPGICITKNLSTAEVYARKEGGRVLVCQVDTSRMPVFDSLYEFSRLYKDLKPKDAYAWMDSKVEQGIDGYVVVQQYIGAKDAVVYNPDVIKIIKSIPPRPRW
jgi:hypothetical protein